MLQLYPDVRPSQDICCGIDVRPSQDHRILCMQTVQINLASLTRSVTGRMGYIPILPVKRYGDGDGNGDGVAGCE